MTPLRRTPPCVHVVVSWAALFLFACGGLDSEVDSFVESRSRTVREWRCGFELALNYRAPGGAGCVQYIAPPPLIVAPDGTHECDAEAWSGLSPTFLATEDVDVFVPAPATKRSAKGLVSWHPAPCP